VITSVQPFFLASHRRFIVLLPFSPYTGMELWNGPSPCFVGNSPSNDDIKSDGSNNLITRNVNFSSTNHLGGFHQDEVGIRVRLLKTLPFFVINYSLRFTILVLEMGTRTKKVDKVEGSRLSCMGFLSPFFPL
jgi:hypothetical protein